MTKSTLSLLIASEFFGMWCADMWQIGPVGGTIRLVVALGLSETEGSVRTTRDFGRIVRILTVIFPETDRANFKNCSFTESLAVAARAP